MAEAKEETPKETVNVSLTSKEAVLVHGLYYTGAAIMNEDFGEALAMAANFSTFVITHMNDEEIIELKRKMTKLGDDIPKEDLTALDIEVVKRS